MAGPRAAAPAEASSRWPRLKARAREIKRDVHAIALATRDPRTPWRAKALAVVVVAYALSPIDLIPDFIPILGYLDDVLLVPLGVMAVIRMIPPDVMAEHRAAATAAAPLAASRAGAIVALWAAALALTAALAWRWLAHC